MEDPKIKNQYRFQEVARQPLPNFAEAEPLPLYGERDSTQKGFLENVFERPVGLGRDIAELFPDVKEARASIEQLKKINPSAGAEAEKMLWEKPTAAKVIGDTLGTALWAVPLPMANALKAAPLLKSFVAGGMYGAAFAGADAIAEGKSLEKTLTEMTTGAIIGAPLMMGGDLIYKFGVKLPIKKFLIPKTPESIKRFLYPVISRLRDMGTIPKEIADDFEKIGVESKQMAGSSVAELSDVGLSPTPRLFWWQKKVPMLNRDEAWRGENSVLDILMRRSSETPPVKEIPVAEKEIGAIPKELQPLAQEARKYKSAEEFVNSQGKTVFRASSRPNDITKSDLPFTVNKNVAEQFEKGSKKGGTTQEFILSKDAKILSEKDNPYLKMMRRFSVDNPQYTILKSKALDFAEKKGFDAVDFSSLPEGEITVLKGKDVLKTKSELIDRYNQAIKQVEPEVKPIPKEELGLSDKIQKAAQAARKVYDEIITLAGDVGMQTQKRQFYFTHHIPNPQTVALSETEKTALATAKTTAEREAIHLQSKAKESLRRDILENMVYKEKAFNNIEKAASVLDGWSEYVLTGQRIINEKNKPFFEYLIKTGQAKSLEEAEGKAFRDFLRRPLPRIPRFGPLEYSRELNVPIYDPDPRRVIPSYVLNAYTRLETARSFGPQNQKLNAMLNKIRKTEGVEVARDVDKLIRTITGQIDRAPAREKLSITLRMLQVPKLSFGQILNISQSYLNTWLGADLGSMAYGLQSAFKDAGVREGLRAGATLQSVINQQLAYFGGGQNFANNILKYTGFNWTELFNRTVTANATKKYVEKTFDKLKANPDNRFLRWRLEEFMINPDEALAKGALTETETLRAMNKGTIMMQFLSDPLYLPEFASSPEGKAFFQFKNYSYNQAIFVKRQLLNPNIPLTHKLRSLLILGTIFPMSGEVALDVRSLLTGAKRPTKAWDRYWSNISNAGTFGLWTDFIESAHYRQVAETIGGPTVGTIADLTENFLASIEKGEPTAGLMKSVFQQTGVLRPVGNYLYPTRRKGMGDVFEFWENL